MAYKSTQRLSLQGPGQQGTSLSCPSTSSGPNSVPGTWSVLVTLCYLHEQKDSKVIAESVEVGEKYGGKPIQEAEESPA